MISRRAMLAPLRGLAGFWRSCPAWLPVFLLFGGAAPLRAVQFGATLDVGTGPATWDQVETDGARAQGTLGAFYRPARVLGLQPELTGDFGLSTERPVRTALRWDVMGRLHTRGEVTGAWLGAGLGGVGTGTRTAALTCLEGGIRSGVGPAGFRVWLARTRFGVRPGVGGSFGNAAAEDTSGAGGKQVVEYTDLGTRAALAFSRYEVGATLVRRWGSAALGSNALRSVAWEVNAVWWVRSSVGLVASVGHSLPELSLALPGARYRSLGVRVALGAPPRGGARSGGGAPPVTAVAAGTSRLVLATPRRLAILGPAADRAEVMGDFTDWQPRPLVRAGERRWVLDTTLSRGVHQLNVRFDGGEWMVPVGTVAVDDGFGGEVGIFVVR
jgi:hypothetical protein